MKPRAEKMCQNKHLEPKCGGQLYLEIALFLRPVLLFARDRELAPEHKVSDGTGRAASRVEVRTPPAMEQALNSSQSL